MGVKRLMSGDFEVARCVDGKFFVDSFEIYKQDFKELKEVYPDAV